MIRILSPKKIFPLLAVIFSLQTFASFVDNGSTKKSNPDMSLKNFSKNSYKNSAYPSFRLSKFQYNGSSNLYQVNSVNSIEGQSFIRMQDGNTTYIYPYKYKVKTSFFKTPSAPNTR
jgi:hypothetical protein